MEAVMKNTVKKIRIGDFEIPISCQEETQKFESDQRLNKFRPSLFSDYQREIIRDLRSIQPGRRTDPGSIRSGENSRGVANPTRFGEDSCEPNDGRWTVHKSNQGVVEDGNMEGHRTHADGMIVATRGKDTDPDINMEIAKGSTGFTIGDDMLLYKEGRRLTKQQAKRARRKFRASMKKQKEQIEVSSNPVKHTDKIPEGKPYIVCHVCKREGHFSFECPNNVSKHPFKVMLNQTNEFLVHGTHSQTWDSMWVVNTFYQNHMAGNRALFKNFKSSFGVETSNEDKQIYFIKGTGEVSVSFDGKSTLIEGVYYVPSLDKNILSMDQLIKQGFRVSIDGDCCHIKKAKDDNTENGSSCGSNSFDERRHEHLSNYFDILDVKSSMGSKGKEDKPALSRMTSIDECVEYLDVLQLYVRVYKYSSIFRESFWDMIEWYHYEYLESPFERPVPPYLSNGTEVDLYDLYLMVQVSGGYKEAIVDDAWSSIAFQMGIEEEMCFELKTIYSLYLEGIEWCYRFKKASRIWVYEDEGETSTQDKSNKRKLSKT